MDIKALREEVTTAFNRAVAKRLNLEEIRKVIPFPLPLLTPRQHQIFSYSDSSVRAVSIQEYADYLNVTEENVVERARALGFAVATMYNAMVKNANLKGDTHVIDLVANGNLHFNFVLNSSPSLIDPAGLIPGWIAFKFAFASFTMLPATLADGSEVVKFAQGKA